MKRIYLDNSATTPVAPEVVEAMMPYLTDKFGNASSIHFFGQEARGAVDRARHQVAALINARPNEIIFTSGGTEANNLAVRGLVESNNKHGRHIITSAIEHSAVKSVCEDLEKQDYWVTYLPVYEDGLVRIEDVEAAITAETVLISIMTANNEIGTIQPVAEIGRLVRGLREKGRKIWFHTDAVQAAGKMPVDVEEIGCDLLSISAHKIYAPKGVGALYVRRGVRLHAQNIGGSQERGIRGGTESVPNIVAFGKACELARTELGLATDYLRGLRDGFESRVGEAIDGLTFNGNRDRRLPNISNISFSRIEGEALLINLDMHGIAVSTGSACSSGNLEPSPVIRALGSDEERARSAIRFSFGRFNAEEEVDRLIQVLPEAIVNLRKLSR
ncbi:MAG TPA: cysteine desulfurase family protein [Pyrinomonadaceae bacterium]|nr:cysteine desulfurase [Acidobacteriota bacterium]HQZ98154.1 cysteine desulfurase family protein [Pyrinomonadaceae bacterium]